MSGTTSKGTSEKILRPRLIPKVVNRNWFSLIALGGVLKWLESDANRDVRISRCSLHDIADDLEIVTSKFMSNPLNCDFDQPRAYQINFHLKPHHATQKTAEKKKVKKPSMIEREKCFFYRQSQSGEKERLFWFCFCVSGQKNSQNLPRCSLSRSWRYFWTRKINFTCFFLLSFLSWPTNSWFCFVYSGIRGLEMSEVQTPFTKDKLKFFFFSFSFL